MQREYNIRMNTKETSIRVGDRVLVKLKRTSKAVPSWDTDSYLVRDMKGSMITAERNFPNQHEITRNISFFKKYIAMDEDEFDMSDLHAVEPVQEASTPNATPLSPTTAEDSAASPSPAPDDPQKSIQIAAKVPQKAGRPSKAESLERKAAKDADNAALQAKRLADPTIRTSEHLLKK
jgi:hypothetical protein